MRKRVTFFHSMFSFRENRVRRLKCTQPLTRYGCRWCLNESYLKVDFLEIDPSSEQNFALHPQLIFISRITFLFLFSRKFAKCICTGHFQIWFSRKQQIWMNELENKYKSFVWDQWMSWYLWTRVYIYEYGSMKLKSNCVTCEQLCDYIIDIQKDVSELKSVWSSRGAKRVCGLDR